MCFRQSAESGQGGDRVPKRGQDVALVKRHADGDDPQFYAGLSGLRVPIPSPVPGVLLMVDGIGVLISFCQALLLPAYPAIHYPGSP